MPSPKSEGDSFRLEKDEKSVDLRSTKTQAVLPVSATGSCKSQKGVDELFI